MISINFFFIFWWTTFTSWGSDFIFVTCDDLRSQRAVSATRSYTRWICSRRLPALPVPRFPKTVWSMELTCRTFSRERARSRDAMGSSSTWGTTFLAWNGETGSCTSKSRRGGTASCVSTPCPALTISWTTPLSATTYYFRTPGCRRRRCRSWKSISPHWRSIRQSRAAHRIPIRRRIERSAQRPLKLRLEFGALVVENCRSSRPQLRN